MSITNCISTGHHNLRSELYLYAWKGKRFCFFGVLGAFWRGRFVVLNFGILAQGVSVCICRYPGNFFHGTSPGGDAWNYHIS